MKKLFRKTKSARCRRRDFLFTERVDIGTSDVLCNHKFVLFNSRFLTNNSSLLRFQVQALCPLFSTSTPGQVATIYEIPPIACTNKF